MPAENCDERKCIYNKPHPIMGDSFYTCTCFPLSIKNGKCEYWDSYQTLIQINLLKTYEEAQKVLKDRKNAQQ